MAQINIKSLGVNNMTLSRNYDAAQTYVLHRDHIMFNEGSNAFSDFCLNSPCGSFANDKIKFLTLPDKGFLFYNANPTGVADYQPVTIGQEMLVKDLIDYKILKFNGEGSFDGQYAINYLTSFKIERFCSGVSTNVITTVNLNMTVRFFGDINPEPPKALDPFIRSGGVTQSGQHSALCELGLNSGIYVNRWGRSGFDIQAGDRAFTNQTGSTPFVGDNKRYRIQSMLIPADEPSYIVQIDNNGFISLYYNCVTIP